MPGAPLLSIRLFGPLDVRIGGNPVRHLRTRQVGWTLALLALRGGRAVERDWLAGALWPDSEREQAYYNLRRCLSELRGALGPQSDRILSPGAHTVALDLSDAEVDALAFDQAIERGDIPSLEQAASLYTGPLLEGCAEAWVLPEREAREQTFLDAVECLAADALRRHDPAHAASYLRRAIAIDPLRETAQRMLMESLSAHGDCAEAVQVYREFRLLVREELQTDPAPETRALYDRVREQARAPAPPAGSHQAGPPCLEPIGGAVALDSAFYVERPTDEQLRAAIARQDSIVLVKGASQAGKTSLVARGLEHARRTGARVVLSDLQALNAAQLASAEALLLALADTLVDQLGLDVSPAADWHALGGPNLSFRRFLQRQVLDRFHEPVVWALDDVDRLLACPFGEEICALFRTWHNQRALDPSGPWSRFTLVIAYATEAHLLITDPHRSPFNVGTRLELEDFTLQQVAELNRLYGRGSAPPLPDPASVRRFHDLVGGHPYLVRRGLHEMTARGLDVHAFEELAEVEGGIYGNHLARMAMLVGRDDELREATRAILGGSPCPSSGSFYRLRSAGIVVGETRSSTRLRCSLYAAYLSRHLR